MSGSKQALLLVDIQYDFLPEGALAVRDGDAILPAVQALLKDKQRWEVVAASQDFHPKGHISFASTHARELFSEIEVTNAAGEPIKQMLWPDHCVQGTRGCEIQEGVREELQSWIDSGKGIIVQKGTDLLMDAYSAFASPTLEKFLRTHGIQTIYVVGLATDYCVRATALDARRAGFDVCVLRDAIRAVGGEQASKQVEAEFTVAGVEVIDTCV